MRSWPRFPAEQLRGPARGVTVRQAVKAVPAQPEPPGPVAGSAYRAAAAGRPGVECGVEAGDGGSVGRSAAASRRWRRGPAAGAAARGR